METFVWAITIYYGVNLVCDLFYLANTKAPAFTRGRLLISVLISLFIFVWGMKLL